MLVWCKRSVLKITVTYTCVRTPWIARHKPRIPYQHTIILVWVSDDDHKNDDGDDDGFIGDADDDRTRMRMNVKIIMIKLRKQNNFDTYEDDYDNDDADDNVGIDDGDAPTHTRACARICPTKTPLFLPTAFPTNR
jgi:hypothetical protein